MRRWIKSITPDRHALEKLWCVKPFAALVVNRGCWTFKRTSVVRAFSLGLMIAFIPPTPLPLHLTLCMALGVLLRLNIPVMMATVFLSNPLTWFPQIAGSLWVGSRLMGLDLMPMLHEASYRNLAGDLHKLLEPLLLGALVLGVCAAAVGYFLAQFAWRARVGLLWRRRRLRMGLQRSAFR